MRKCGPTIQLPPLAAAVPSARPSGKRAMVRRGKIGNDNADPAGANKLRADIRPNNKGTDADSVVRDLDPASKLSESRARELQYARVFQKLSKELGKNQNTGIALAIFDGESDCHFVFANDTLRACKGQIFDHEGVRRVRQTLAPSTEVHAEERSVFGTSPIQLDDVALPTKKVASALYAEHSDCEDSDDQEPVTITIADTTSFLVSDRKRVTEIMEQMLEGLYGLLLKDLVHKWKEEMLEPLPEWAQSKFTEKGKRLPAPAMWPEGVSYKEVHHIKKPELVKLGAFILLAFFNFPNPTFLNGWTKRLKLSIQSYLYGTKAKFTCPNTKSGPLLERKKELSLKVLDDLWQKLGAVEEYEASRRECEKDGRPAPPATRITYERQGIQKSLKRKSISDASSSKKKTATQTAPRKPNPATQTRAKRPAPGKKLLPTLFTPPSPAVPLPTEPESTSPASPSRTPQLPPASIEERPSTQDDATRPAQRLLQELPQEQAADGSVTPDAKSHPLVSEAGSDLDDQETVALSPSWSESHMELSFNNMHDFDQFHPEGPPPSFLDFTIGNAIGGLSVQDGVHCNGTHGLPYHQPPLADRVPINCYHVPHMDMYTGRYPQYHNTDYATPAPRNSNHPSSTCTSFEYNSLPAPGMFFPSPPTPFGSFSLDFQQSVYHTQ